MLTFISHFEKILFTSLNTDFLFGFVTMISLRCVTLVTDYNTKTCPRKTSVSFRFSFSSFLLIIDVGVITLWLNDFVNFIPYFENHLKGRNVGLDRPICDNNNEVLLLDEYIHLLFKSTIDERTFGGFHGFVLVT